MDINFKEQELNDQNYKIKSTEENLVNYKDDFEKDSINYTENQNINDQNLKSTLEKIDIAERSINDLIEHKQSQDKEICEISNLQSKFIEKNLIQFQNHKINVINKIQLSCNKRIGVLDKQQQLQNNEGNNFPNSQS